MSTSGRPSTEKLYWADALAISFEAQGAMLGSHAGKPSIVLPRTMFYPEGGGQLGDRGTIAFGPHVLRVADTQVEQGEIHHVLEDAVPAALAEALGAATDPLDVRGVVDEARRRDHMVQHTAQHALSRALADAARADTVSARLGASACTIDVGRPGISDADLHRVEDLVNTVVVSDVAVHTSFPTPGELAELDLRKRPNAEKSAAGVRVVTIEGFDVTPCGGTHCTRTGQIGQIRVTNVEKYKGMLRVSFHAGRRALTDARTRHGTLAALASDLTCGQEDVLAAVAKLRGEMKGLRERLDATRSELVEVTARRLLDALPSSGPQLVSVERPRDDLVALRALAGKLAEAPRVLALVVGEDEGSGERVVVIQRGAEILLDCGAFVTTHARTNGGRGGGRPERAEGRFPRETSVERLASAATAAITAGTRDALKA